MTFRIKSGHWTAHPDYVAALAQSFPAVDVPQCLRTAQAWCEANPAKRKTSRGMPRFLVAWLAREQAKLPAAPKPRPALGAWRDECQQVHGGTCGNQHFHAAKMQVGPLV